MTDPRPGGDLEENSRRRTDHRFQVTNGMTIHRFATQSANLRVHSDEVRLETHDGRDHVVADCTLVREMVLKGQLLPFGEIQRTALAWNGAPVTVSHPTTDDGEFLPASQDAEAFETYATGRLFNVEADENSRALVGEVWLDADRAEQSAEALGRDDPAALLEEGEGPLEVSTGYWYRQENASGEYDGEEYDAVQMDVQPDHLAVLPNSEGECSLEDGCGLARPDDGSAAAAAASSDFQSDGHATAQGQADGGPLRAAINRLEAFLATAGASPDAGSPEDLSAACNCSDDCSCGAGADADVTGNQSVGDAVRWESDGGGSVGGYRYGVIVDGLQDDAEDQVLVAVYEPGSDGWENRNEQNPMSTDRLEVVGSDGVGSLPPIDQIRGNDADPDADGQSTTGGVVAIETNSGYMAYNFDELASASGLSVATLEAMDEDEIESLAETVLADDGDGDGDGNDDDPNRDPDDPDSDNSDDDQDPQAAQAAEALQSRIDELEERLEEQAAGASREDLEAQVREHADVSDAAIEAMSTSDLSELAEKVTPTGGVYAGRRGSAQANDDEDVPATGASLADLGGDA